MADKPVHNKTATIGDDVKFTSTFKVKATGAAIDLSTNTFQAQLRNSETKEEVTSGVTLDTASAATGIIIVHIPKSISINLSAGTYITDLTWRNADSEQLAVIRYVIDFDEAVTVWQ